VNVVEKLDENESVVDTDLDNDGLNDEEDVPVHDIENVIECENDENVIEGVNDFVEVIVYDTLGV
jgi:hypothetical protein